MGPRPPGGGSARRYDDPESAAAEEGLIRVLYIDPALCRRAALPDAESFSSPLLGRIYACILERIRRGESADASHLAGMLTQEESSALVQIIDQPVGMTNREQALKDYIEKITQRQRQRSEKVDLLALQTEMQGKKGYKG